MNNTARIVMPIVAVACLTPWMPSALALVSGIFISIVLGNPYLEFTKKHTQTLLTWSVMGLGFGMNLAVVARVGLQGIGYTVVGIAFALAIGFMLGRLLSVDKETTALISVGTAICGGSAIAAVGPAIGAKAQSMTLALATVFLFNAFALLIFPPLGHALGLTQPQFGLWSALAIHDTSSVVGSALQYGAEALQIATTVKLARALWIVPLTLIFGWLWSKNEKSPTQAKRPWFILGFVIAAALVTWIPATQPAGHIIELLAKRTLVLTLFFIGANLNRETLKIVGFAPLVHGFLLWLAIGGATLGAILSGAVN